MVVKTGVVGLDKLLDGGYPDNSIILISGGTGTGKTILSLQFLLQGFLQKERGMFITFEQSKDKIIDQCARFGWDFEKYEKQNLFRIVTMEDIGIANILTQMKSNIEEFKPQRMVVDSITFMSLSAYSAKRLIDLDRTTMVELYEASRENSVSSEFDGLIVRKLLIDFVKILQKRKINTLLTSEIPRESVWLSRDTFSEYACDGVLLLKSVAMGTDLHRAIEIVKMRNTKMKGGVYGFDFQKNGIKVNI
ncbi:Circadian clock protein kinase KaiC [Candidatus Bilamarchaeum dharawalense]|uniref:Circadian clock protein kinase KaiC n=1 Tax=Candidatus Bilamarchaeum dharawalense TaxID=2885759 RepID=A0A5E4LVH3_9ARCH|nr:Circadian clock protein kinase KaiC [Candidatus Bilamarchaeum dharawalense]